MLSIFMTLTGLSAMGVLTRTSGGFSFMRTCFEQVLPVPAAPMKTVTVLRDLTWPFFMASLKRCFDWPGEVGT